MRACAILMVVIGHCTWIFPSGDGAANRFLSFSGYFGVEIFFVLSGFLIGNILYRMFLEFGYSRRSVVEFLKRRWFRTLPNYFLILLLNLLIASLIGYEVRDEWKYFFFIQNFAAPMLPFFPESWSLAIEEIAYLILPFTLLLFAGISQRSKSRGFIIAIACLLVLSIGAKWAYHFLTPAPALEQWNISLRMVVVYRLDAIFTGVVFSWLFNNFKLMWNRTRFFTAAIGVLMLGFFLFGIGKFQLTIDQFPLFWTVLYLPLTSLTIALFLPLLSGWVKERQVFAQPITFISLISYSVYLVHYGIVLQLLKYFFEIESSTAFELTGFVTLYFVLTFILSYVLYRFYEKPMMDLRDKC